MFVNSDLQPRHPTIYQDKEALLVTEIVTCLTTQKRSQTEEYSLKDRFGDFVEGALGGQFRQSLKELSLRTTEWLSSATTLCCADYVEPDYRTLLVQRVIVALGTLFWVFVYTQVKGMASHTGAMSTAAIYCCKWNYGIMESRIAWILLYLSY